MRYVALLRGINSGKNPTVRMDALRRAFEHAGFEHVSTLLASGNVLFAPGRSTSEQALVQRLEPVLARELKFDCRVLVRSAAEIARLVRAAPFATVAPDLRPQVTFLASAPPAAAARAFREQAGPYLVTRIADRTVCCVVDPRTGRTPDLMRLLQRSFGSAITTRTWNTVERIHAALEA